MNRPLVLVGHSAAMRRIALEITAAAASNLTVLISGESGVGRRLIARTIHERSPRHSGPFLSVNCVCLPDARLESELFGHANTGIDGCESHWQRGRLEEADGGTVVLQEVGFLSWRLQGRLHRFVDTHIIQCGSSRSTRSDVRLVAITHRSLLHTIGYQPFRDDLFSRINLISIEVPPLRDRSDDVPALFRYFACVQAARSGRPVPELTSDALSCLSEYDWPGNVCELKDLAERLTDVATSDRIGIDELPKALVRRSMARTMARWGASTTAPVNESPAARRRH
jgi:DNA-binding NtrC family response regulator